MLNAYGYAYNYSMGINLALRRFEVGPDKKILVETFYPITM